MVERSRLTSMRIVNFRCVGSKGLTVELSDIVCLVGANNSGKSTVLSAYEAAVNQTMLESQDINCGASGQSATVELWVHIPSGAGNVDEKWKESKDGLLLVRSKWEWPPEGGKPVRTTWDPSTSAYAEDGKASGLDTVFNSRLPKPFRIGSLEDPEEEHRKLLTLVLEPVVNKLKTLMQDDDSELRKKILALQAEAEKPVAEFRQDINGVESRVNTSYKRVFSSAEIKLNVNLGEIKINPENNLLTSSRVDIVEPHGRTRWNQQGTGSQRALFWSMLQVRSELNRIAEERKQRDKQLREKTKELKKHEKEILKLKKADVIQKRNELIDRLKEDINVLEEGRTSASTNASEEFLPGYMLLIDEPETALHPAVVRAAKEHLYSLAAEIGWQVMLSTHHPAFVDPMKDHTTIVRLYRPEVASPPNVYVSDEIAFAEDEKENLKSLLAFDNTVAEMFFGSRVVIVEGDTEFAAFTETMNNDMDSYPFDDRPLIMRARGKATIQILIKILCHFGLDFAVLHDIDSPKTKKGNKKSPAYSINKNISDNVKAARDAGISVVHRCSCPVFETQHGMDLPDKEKPFAACTAIRNDAGIRDSVRKAFEPLSISGSDDGRTHDEDGQHYEIMLRSWVRGNAVDDSVYNFEA